MAKNIIELPITVDKNMHYAFVKIIQKCDAILMCEQGYDRTATEIRNYALSFICNPKNFELYSSDK